MRTSGAVGQACVVAMALIVQAHSAVAVDGLTLEIIVGDDAPVVVAPLGVPVGVPPATQYGGNIGLRTCSIGWQLLVDAAADVANSPALSGSLVVTNQAVVPQLFTITLRNPALTACPLDNTMGGSALLTMLVDDGGGSVTAPPGGALWHALIDDREVATLFDGLDVVHPNFGIVLLGPESFGDPIPSEPVVGVTEAIGLRYVFTLSGGETLTISSSFLVAFLQLDCPNPADLDGDGIVDGADLGILLKLWGSDDRLADLNGDGIVDGADLGVQLSAWTIF